MIDFIVTNQAMVREYINGICMVLFLTLSIMVVVYMWDVWVESDFRHWKRTPGIPTACALGWVFVAETYRTGSVWLLYQSGKAYRDNGVFFSQTGFGPSIGYLIAGFMLIGGLLRAIYLFTPPGSKPLVWVYASIASVVFVMTPTLYHLITGS